MKRIILASTLAVSLSACATNPYGYNDPYYGNRADGSRVATGAALGGAAGAVVGAIVPGVNPVTGAIAGAVLGGVAGAVIKGRQYYRDTRGYCYYTDQYGNPIYDYNTRC
ncbi:glycine zipper domain-containing protein [Sphingomonas sp. LY29]|uniref:glycine zipper domain-containing protein n=1 Tax=Sphingomonas sp. LY29 TaxID=3095341 RepID=UPI002D78DCB5|nr:glycine zipper domain-containing protein [Sphingomonas sp. LY29]WRP26119.1 glycine zipper domain-containing protein [Sphingomonas sp. LY29]